MPVLSSLEVASGHFARLVVTLHVIANLLAFNDFAHASAFDGGDMDKCVRATVVRLNEAVALGGIEPFNGASGHERPFHSKLSDHSADAADGDGDFERKVRSGRNANAR
jgi:hypothetical protein